MKKGKGYNMSEITLVVDTRQYEKLTKEQSEYFTLCMDAVAILNAHAIPEVRGDKPLPTKEEVKLAKEFLDTEKSREFCKELDKLYDGPRPALFGCFMMEAKIQ